MLHLHSIVNPPQSYDKLSEVILGKLCTGNMANRMDYVCDTYIELSTNELGQNRRWAAETIFAITGREQKLHRDWQNALNLHLSKPNFFGSVVDSSMYVSHTWSIRFAILHSFPSITSESLSYDCGGFTIECKWNMASTMVISMFFGHHFSLCSPEYTEASTCQSFSCCHPNKLSRQRHRC